MGLALAILRQAPAVAGVLFFGWPVLPLALFFLLDLWLTLTARGALEVTYQSGGLAGNLAWMGGTFGTIVFVAACNLWVALPADELARFTGGGWRDPWFLASLGLLVVAQGADAVRFHGHLRTRSEGEAEADARSLWAHWARPGLVAFGAAVLMPFAAWLGQGTAAIALLLAAVNVLAEAFPSSLARLLD